MIGATGEGDTPTHTYLDRDYTDKKGNLTSYKQCKVLHICWIHSIPIGGYTGVGTRVSVHGVV